MKQDNQNFQMKNKNLVFNQKIDDLNLEIIQMRISGMMINKI